MNKAQKIVILIALVIVLFSVVYPPYLTIRDGVIKNSVRGSDWDWIFNLKSERKEVGEYVFTDYQKIRFDILLCEILAIGILATFLVLIVGKKKEGES